MIRLACTSFAFTVVVGCYDADPRSVEGALDAAARAIEAGDGERLFRVIDERSRHAMYAIVKARRAAAALIEADYPPEERAAALAALGDAATVKDGPALFARRCDRPCMDGFAAQLGAPTKRTQVGDEVVVETTRGGTLHMYAGSDGWFGLVWRTEALAEERTRAARELTQIRDNAATYRRRRELEGGGRTRSGSSSDQPTEGSAR